MTRRLPLVLSSPLSLLPLVALVVLHAPEVQAHKPSDSYLRLTPERASSSEQRWQGHWDLSLRDLDRDLLLDANGDGELTWGELRPRESQILSHATTALTISTSAPCTITANPLQITHHTDGTYARLPLHVRCPPGPLLTIHSTLFFPQDPQHRTLVDLPTTTLILTFTNPSSSSSSSSSSSTSPSSASASPSPFLTFTAQGIQHIWLGLDHILFLFALLLPSVLRRTATGWTPAPSLTSALRDVVRIVTAFTLAHSLTLALASLGILRVSPTIIEPAIAASVAVAAANNVWPLFGRDRWVMALSLGLLHGFGFSSVLADVGLPRDRLLSGLFGFNLGVELGQLALVALFVPLAFAVRRHAGYRRFALVGGSLAIACLAVLWFVERALELSIIRWR